ncbi:MAG: hypothetical protein QG632_14 [Candidatus Dependentiae bacterium]|nr:hypothetical protein [Candidatus Dependentiae bacterium]
MTQHILSHLHKILPQEQSWKLKILREWHLILGPLSRKVVLQRVDDHAVVLAVAHPGLAQELLMLTDLIRSKINESIGHEAITTIHFRTLIKRDPHVDQSAKKVMTAPIIQEARKPLSAAESKHLTTITNKELRDALAEFYATCKERTRT